MSKQTKRLIGEGVGYGVVAGVIFGLMEMIGAAMMGDPALMPVRMFASVVAGKDALMSTGGATLALGVSVHVALSAIYGVIYAGLNAGFAKGGLSSYGTQAGVGLLFGLALWLVNFQVIARFAYPWFLEAPQLLQAMMHALFYGLPLGILIAATERRTVRAQVPATA